MIKIKKQNDFTYTLYMKSKINLIGKFKSMDEVHRYLNKRFNMNLTGIRDLFFVEIEKVSK